MTCLGCSSLGQDNLANAKIGVRVVDDEQNPIADAQVKFVFDLPKTSNPWDGIITYAENGKTDSKGIFFASHEGLDRFGSYVEKTGFYPSSLERHFDGQINNKWQPWGQIYNLILRKKVAPTAMFAKKILSVPTNEVPAGYDLMAGDWLPPYGKGITNDLNFTLNREFYSSPMNYG
jgi:hypothetical protein